MSTLSASFVAMLKPHSEQKEGTHTVYPHTFGNTFLRVLLIGVKTALQSRTAAQPDWVTRIPPGASLVLHMS